MKGEKKLTRGSTVYVASGVEQFTEYSPMEHEASINAMKTVGTGT